MTDEVTDGHGQKVVCRGRRDGGGGLGAQFGGWNVRWNDLSKVEQEAYIRRAENIMKGW